ncbi:YagK/YfjJ domain-containing protein [Halopseudomonas pelagia]|uniref:YagK/YfjJ domain-containing protein n=1 Tax=Halopseudomonas pelagia TaxID=553151 RepID=UPI0030DA0CE2
MERKGPFVAAYLSRLKHTIDRALAQYPRVLAFRVDLRLPADQSLPDRTDDHGVISRFTGSFKAKVRHCVFRAIVTTHSVST